MDEGAWQATVHWVTKSWTEQLHFTLRESLLLEMSPAPEQSVFDKVIERSHISF